MNILCVGEPLVRLATLGTERLDNAQTLDVSYSGAEAVVAITLSQLGESVCFASKVSDNRLGSNALMFLSRYGVDTSRVIRSADRMGIYYSERGHSIRPSVVTYDRSGTAMANASHEDFDWDHLLNGIEVFFFSGVVPAISDEMNQAILEGLRECKGRGIRTIMDLNYRETMWRSREVAQQKIGKLLPLVDQLIASEDDILSYGGGNVEEGMLFDYCLSWARSMMADYSLSLLCFVDRQLDRHDFAAIRGALVTRDGVYLSPTQQVSVVDMSSSGSVFAAAVVHGHCSNWDKQSIVDFATMASAFKATVSGDFSFATETELASLLTDGVKPSIRQ